MKSSISSVRRLVHQLEALGISYALGGSALLLSLDLGAQVRDWDITTDAPLEVISEALTKSGYSWEALPSGDGPYASQYRLSLSLAVDSEEDSVPIDLIGSFAIRSESGLCRLPCHAAFEWEGLKMASPEIWAAAYALMGRQAKAELLYGYLREHGANQEMIRLLLVEPLPPHIRAEFDRMPAKGRRG